MPSNNCFNTPILAPSNIVSLALLLYSFYEYRDKQQALCLGIIQESFWSLTFDTPHYYDEESISHQKEWLPIFDFYDKDYKAENEPYQMLSTQKMLELSQGVEPVVYRETHKRSKAEVLQVLRWDGNEWGLN